MSLLLPIVACAAVLTLGLWAMSIERVAVAVVKVLVAAVLLLPLVVLALQYALP